MDKNCETKSIDSFIVEVYSAGGKEYIDLIKETGIGEVAKYTDTFEKGSDKAVKLVYAFAELMGVLIVAKEG